MYQALVCNVFELPVEICEAGKVGARKAMLQVCVGFFIGDCFLVDPDSRAARLEAGLRLENRKSLSYALVDGIFELRSHARCVGPIESLMRQNPVCVSQIEEWDSVRVGQVPAIAADFQEAVLINIQFS